MQKSQAEETCTVKELTAKFFIDDPKVRSIIGLFDIPSVGEKPKTGKGQGTAAKLYLLSNFQKALDAIEAAKPTMVRP